MDASILNSSLYSTYTKFNKEYGKNNDQEGLLQVKEALIRYMRDNDANYFTKTNNARGMLVANIAREELATYLSEYFVQLSKKDYLKDFDELILGFQVLGTTNQLAINQIRDCLLGRIDSFGSVSCDKVADIVCDVYNRIEMRQIAEDEKKLARRTQINVSPRYGVRNLQVNSQLVNYCREEVLSGKQIAIQNDLRRSNSHVRPRREYNLNDEMIAVTDIGQKRKTQQDSVLMLYHPKNPNYKFLVVADGMGGSVDGDKASQEIARQMVEWFETLNPDMMLEVNNSRLRYEWDRKLNEINDYILSTTPNSGSTFVGAIVGEESTTIASIGDSRCYALGYDGELYQMTTDDNIDFLKYKAKWDNYRSAVGGRLSEYHLRLMKRDKDDLRFRRDANKILKCIGANTEGPVGTTFNRLNNSSYKALMLFSDGVTDCLSDTKLLAITRDTLSKDLARRIVDEAITVKSVRPDLVGSSEYYSEIAAGKDNTSAVIYNKRNDMGER